MLYHKGKGERACRVLVPEFNPDSIFLVIYSRPIVTIPCKCYLLESRVVTLSHVFLMHLANVTKYY